jgi:photosystem II stability/assembly factor-like uncharacterized protein
VTNGIYTPPPLTSYTIESITAVSAQDTTKSGSFKLAVQRSRPAGTWSVTGPPGGSIVPLAQDPSHPDVVYVGGSDLGGLWKSTDGGATWSTLFTGTSVDSATLTEILVFDSGQTIVVGGGILAARSTDGGSTWSTQLLPSACGSIGAVAVNRQNDSILYLSCEGYGLMKSQDKGSTWTLLSGSPITTQVLHNALQVDPNNGNIVYYGTTNGLFISADAGLTWTASNNGFVATDISIRDLAVDPANTGKILALAGTPTSTVVTLYQSTDGGNTWTALASGLVGERVVPDPTNASVIYLYGLECHAVYRSTDAGLTFSSSDNGVPVLPCSNPVSLFGPTGSMIVLNTSPESYLITIAGSGAWKSLDGQNWTLSTQGISAYTGCAVGVDPENPQTVFWGACNGGGTFKSTDGGNTWTPVFSDSTAIAVDPFDSRHVLVHASSGLFESLDGGITWTEVTNLPTPPSGTPGFIFDIAFHPSKSGVIFISTQRGGGPVLRSIDGGASWQILVAGLQTSNTAWDWAYTPVIVSPTDPDTIFVGMADGLYKSTDLGNSWQLVGFQNEQVNGLAIDANSQPVSLYASPYSGAVSKSDDLGSTWTSLNVSGSAVVDPSSANSLFLICGSGCSNTASVSWSPDGGQSWMSMSQGLDIATIGYNGWSRAYAVARTQPQVLFVTSINRSILRNVTGP